MIYSQNNTVCNGGGIPLNDVIKSRDPSDFLTFHQYKAVLQIAMIITYENVPKFEVENST